MKSGSPSRTTAAHKTQTKIQAWSSLVFHCCHSSFNPSEAPLWDTRPVSGAGVVHYQLLHRPRSVPTALSPAPLVTYPHRPSQAGGYSRDCALLPPSPLSRGEPVRAAAAYLGVRTDEAREKETEGWGVTEKREGREKKKNLGLVPGHTAARSSTSWAVHSRCHAMVLDIFGGRPDAPPPPGGRRWLLRSRAAGSESPVPCSSPNMADGSRLRPPGERGRLLRSLLDGSHPSSTQEHGSESSVPLVLPLLQHHRFGQPLAVSASSCCPISSAPRSPSAARALWQHVPPSSRVSGTNVTKFIIYGKKEAGTGEHLRHFNNKINKHKWKAAAPHGRLPHIKHKLKFRPGPLSSSTVVTPHLTLPKLLRGTRDRWVVQVSFITNYSTGLAPFPRLSAPPHSSQYNISSVDTNYLHYTFKADFELV